MSARRSLFILTALLVALGPGRARADGDADTRARDRTVFFAALAVTGAGVAGWVFAGTRVSAAEDDLDALGPEVGAEQDLQADRFDDICAAADADDGPASAEAISTCRRGKRWTRIANASGLVAIGSAAVATIFAYRAFRATDRDDRAAPPPRSAWRAIPIATPTAVGLGVDAEF